MPGWKSGSVGYHTDDGIIFHDNNQKQTKGKEARLKSRARSVSFCGVSQDVTIPCLSLIN